MNIQQLASRGRVRTLEGRVLTPEDLENVYVFSEATLRGRLRIDGPLHIGKARVGYGVNLYRGVYVDDLATVEDKVEIGSDSTILRGSLIGRMTILRPRVLIGRSVHIPAEAQIGADMIIPSSQTIMVLGRLGMSRRMMTVHGAQGGPRFSAGCQYSDTWLVIEDRIKHAIGTTSESAAHYQHYLGVLKCIGDEVQDYWNSQTELIGQLVEEVELLRHNSPISQIVW
jgi:carbonic anhydrase/acetyltransferase-like protein (isoleucine patch superfamily)